MSHQDLNSIVIVGRLTADPKAETLPTGTTKSRFSIANNYFGCNKSQEVNFFDAVAFGKMADVCNTWMKKGMMIAVRGTLRQQRWQDRQTGGNRSRVEIIINDMQMLGSKNENGERSPGADPSQASGGQPPPTDSGFNDDEVPF